MFYTENILSEVCTVLKYFYYLCCSQLLPDRRRVQTFRCLTHVVCVHTYIYVVCEPRHGEFDTSAAAQHTQLLTQYSE
jgi:hypothetical protein